MNIVVYEMDDCAICVKAKTTLRMMGLPFMVASLRDATECHDGWREAEAVDLRAALAANNDEAPIIKIDGKFMSYDEAMGAIRKRAIDDIENKPACTDGACRI
jgi:glutaredoxin